jgi:acetyl esterase
VTSTTVDPDIKTLLDALAAMDGPTTAELGPEGARESYRTFASLFPGPEGVEVEDATIPGEAGPVAIRTYRPVEGEPTGLLVWYHGGGFLFGGIDTADSTARQLAVRAGCTVVSVDYRLSPEHPYPAAVDDAWSALRWVSEHAGDLAGAGGRIAVGGDSAGGTLAALMAIQARDAGLDLCHQLLVYPLIDLAGTFPSRVENGEGYLLTQETMEWFEHHYLGDHEPHDPLVSPLYADVSRVAPAHVITAGFDPLRDEGEAYASGLRTAGVEVVDDRYPSMIHEFVRMTTVTTVAEEALERAASLLRAAFGSAA